MALTCKKWGKNNPIWSVLDYIIKTIHLLGPFMPCLTGIGFIKVRRFIKVVNILYSIITTNKDRVLTVILDFRIFSVNGHGI